MHDPVLANEWIAVCKSTDLAADPKPVAVLGERLVLFRNDRGVQAFRDLCVHRGAALSLGTVRNGRLVCPYHAWEYDDTGRCVHIPQLAAGQPIPTQARVTRYACQESSGLVWVNLRTPRTEPLVLEEFTQPGFHNVVWGPQQVHALPPRIIENFLDVGHLPIVHEGYLGESSRAEIGDYQVHDVDGILRSDEIAIYQPDPYGTGQATTVYYTYEILRPLTVRFTKRDPVTDDQMSMLLTILPETEASSIAFGIMSFNHATGMTDEDLIRFQDLIFSQDKPIVEHQKPEELPLDLQAELSLKSDRVSIAYRRYLARLGVTFGTA